METINQSVLDYINSENTLGALQIDGPWGCGKTYYIKNNLLPIIEKNESDREKEKIHEKRISLMISLFGIKSIDDISRQLLFASTHSRFGLSEKGIERVKRMFSNAAKIIPYLKDIDWEKTLQIPPSECLKLLGEDTIIILDDLERLSSDIDTEDVLGFVNDLVENYNFKVIIISNQEHIRENAIRFKEKVVDKIIPFDIDTFSIIKSMAKSFHPRMSNFLELEEVNRYLQHNTIDSEYNKALSNLRTIRFALSQFYPFFNYFIGTVDKFENISNEIIQKLCVIWRFTLAIAIEYRLGTISLDKPNQLENAGFNFNLNRFISNKKQQEDGDGKEEKVSSFEEKFIERYYVPFDITYLFIPGVYNYVLRGGNISFESVDEIVSKELGIWEEPMDEDLSYVCKFFGRISQLSDEKAGEEFLKFIDLISKGHVEKLSTIINAANILFSYQEVFGLSPEEIENEIIKGIDRYLLKIDDETIKRQEYELNAFLGDLRDEAKPCLKYAYAKIRTRMEVSRKEYVKILNEKFNHNMKDFATEFLPYQVATNIYVQSSPVLHLMDLQMVESKMQNLSSNEVVELRNMLYYRFGEGRVSTNVEEREFLIAIKKGLSTLSENEKTLSAHFKRLHLVPYIENLLS